jgi:hypothetical protein
VTDALQQRELLAEKRRRDEEAAAIQQAQLYSSLGMRAQPYRPASEEQVGVAPASSMDRAALTSALQRGMGVEPPTRDGATTSFQRSVQRGMGVEPTQAGATLSPLQSAFQKATSGDLASSYTKRTAETPGIRQKLPGMEVAWQAGPTDEEKIDLELKKYEAQQGVLDKREQAKLDRENRGYFDVLQKAGQIPKDATFDMYQNIPLKPAFDDYRQQVSMAGAMQRAQVQAGAQAQMGTYVQGIGAEGEAPQLYFGTRGGQITPTGIQATTKAGGTGVADRILTDTKPLQPDELETLKQYMPTPRYDTNGKIVGYNPPKVQLSPAGALLGRQGGRQGVVGDIAYSMSGEDAQRLSSLLNIVSDRRAAQEEGGRLSEGDIQRRRDAISVRSGDVNNYEQLYRKISRAIRWATDDAEGQARLPEGTPAGGDALVLAFPDKAAQIQRARAAGYSDAEIRQKLGGGR